MIKLLIGGSPCTKFSIAQRKDRELTLEGEGGELFKNYYIAKELFQPDYFLYENNCSAALSIKEGIESFLGQQRIEVNSAIVSAQNRCRFYVSNLPFPKIEDRGMVMRDIVNQRDNTQTFYENITFKENPKPSRFGLIKVGNINNSDSQGNRVYSLDGKGPTLCGSSGGLGAKTGLFLMDNNKARKLTVKEAKKQQTIPDWYDMSIVSENQSLKMLGNGWTVDIISNFLNQLPKDEELIVLSMYDGMGCGLISLKELGYVVKEYIAVEIDKNCKIITKHNFPFIDQYNDAFDIRNTDSALYKRVVSYN